MTDSRTNDAVIFDIYPRTNGRVAATRRPAGVELTLDIRRAAANATQVVLDVYRADVAGCQHRDAA
jgi:hypothetical protein